MTRAQRTETWSPHLADWASGWHVASVSRRLARTLCARVDAELEGCGITAAQLDCLDRLAHDGDTHVAAMARTLGIRRQSAATLIARLQRPGLVELLPLDERVRVPVITPVGERRRQQAHRAIASTIRLIERLELDERAWFVDTATRLDTTLQRGDPVW